VTYEARIDVIALLFAVLLSGARAFCQTSTPVLAPVSAQTPVQLPATGTPQWPNVLNVKDFGVVGDGKTMDTLGITKAVHAANAAGGGTVVFPPGVYLTGTVELLSNVALDLEAGAVIEGSTNVADYGSITEYGFGRTYGINSTGEGEKVGIIVARHAKNIALLGQGVIDGNGDTFFDMTKPHYGMDFDPQYTRQGKDFMKSMLDLEDGPVEARPTGRPGTMIIFFNCENVLIRDVTLSNAPNWTLNLFNSQRSVVTGIHIVNSLLLPNNDGIDCINCKDVHFSDCDIRAGDDDFAFYGSENITVTNCSLVSHSSGIRLEDSRYSTFTNLSIHANRGVGIYEREGTTANLTFSGITVETQLLTGHWWGKGEPIFIAVGPPREGGKSGEVRDVRFSNIIGEAEGGVVLYGDSGSWIHNIYLDHIKLKIRAPRKKVSELAGGNFDFRWTATSLANAVFKHDIPGMYCRYIDGLNIDDFKVQWGDDLPDYFSNGVQCEDFKNLEIDGFEGRQALRSSKDPAIVLRHGEGVSVRDSKADPGTAVFLSTVGVQDEGLFVNNDLRQARRVFFGVKNGFHSSGNYLPVPPKREPAKR
jgi:parallel beta-helix repeat protein